MLTVRVVSVLCDEREARLKKPLAIADQRCSDDGTTKAKQEEGNGEQHFIPFQKAHRLGTGEMEVIQEAQIYAPASTRVKFFLDSGLVNEYDSGAGEKYGKEGPMITWKTARKRQRHLRSYYMIQPLSCNWGRRLIVNPRASSCLLAVSSP